MTPNFEIKKAQKSDALFISKLLVQLGYDTEFSKIESLISPSSSNETQVDSVYVAVLNNDIVGVISLIFFDYFPSAEKLCRITALVVDEDMRGTGIGSKLIDHAKSIALTEGCNALELTTSMKREKTQAYYESIGFQKTSFKYVKTLKEKVS